jgi:hypothetical protein
VRDFLVEMAGAFDTPRPYAVPYSLGRLTMPVGAHLFGRTVLRLSAAKATTEFDWSPTYPNFRTGITHWARTRGMQSTHPAR